jgi:polyhydroxyalkanoate synthase
MLIRNNIKMGKKTIIDDDLFAKIAVVNKEWFNNLLAEDKLEKPPKNNMFIDIYKQFFEHSKEYLESQQKFYTEQISNWGNVFKGSGYQAEEISDKVVADSRFSDVEWENNPFFAYLKNSYLSTSQYLLDTISKSNMDQIDKSKFLFFMQQYLDAISPTNFALTNPEVIKSVVETGGASLVGGMRNIVEDMKNGYINMTDSAAFTVGKNLAITKGKIVFKNELIELIQYSPTDTSVFATPLLIIPPFINKYYILDLQESNSLVKYLVKEGYTVFLVSWKSADSTMTKFKWEDYVELGVIKASEVVSQITKVGKINTLGYCIGGVILTTAYLVMQSRGIDRINSMAHITTMLDHTDPGDIKFFIDRDFLALKDAQKSSGGIMSGRIISQTFSALRAKELVWNYWISNYLLGKTPHPFDILYWNNDVVDLPLLVHSFLLKELYLNNNLVKGGLNICGALMDISKIQCPMYLFAAQKDHIVPWHSAYKTLDYVTCNARFVLGASGHTAGVINPVSSDKRGYWVNDVLMHNPEDWFKDAVERSGSWWKDFSIWLARYSGDKNTATKALGNKEYKPLYDTPGEYAKSKAMSIIEAQST